MVTMLTLQCNANFQVMFKVVSLGTKLFANKVTDIKLDAVSCAHRQRMQIRREYKPLCGMIPKSSKYPRMYEGYTSSQRPLEVQASQKHSRTYLSSTCGFTGASNRLFLVELPNYVLCFSCRLPLPGLP